MSAWERAQTAAEEAELRAAIEASLLDAAPAGEVAKAAVPKSPARAKVSPLLSTSCGNLPSVRISAQAWYSLDC